MELKGRLRRELVATARAFTDALDHINPTAHINPTDDSNYPERMVSYYYIQALARALAPASVLLELPVTGKRGHRMDNHVDALIFNDREVIVAEFKLGWAPSHWEALARDLARLQGPVAREIRRKFTDKRRRRPWVFLGADCWRENVADVWKSGKPAIRRTLPPALGKAYRDYVPVWEEKGTSFDGYYLTWALLPFDEMSA